MVIMGQARPLPISACRCGSASACYRQISYTQDRETITQKRKDLRASTKHAYVYRQENTQSLFCS